MTVFSHLNKKHKFLVVLGYILYAVFALFVLLLVFDAPLWMVAATGAVYFLGDSISGAMWMADEKELSFKQGYKCGYDERMLEEVEDEN